MYLFNIKVAVGVVLADVLRLRRDTLQRIIFEFRALEIDRDDAVLPAGDILVVERFSVCAVSAERLNIFSEHQTDSRPFGIKFQKREDAVLRHHYYTLRNPFLKVLF